MSSLKGTSLLRIGTPFHVSLRYTCSLGCYHKSTIGLPRATALLCHYLATAYAFIHTGHTCHREMAASFLISSKVMAVVQRVLPSIPPAQHLCTLTKNPRPILLLLLLLSASFSRLSAFSSAICLPANTAIIHVQTILAVSTLKAPQKYSVRSCRARMNKVPGFKCSHSH